MENRFSQLEKDYPETLILQLRGSFYNAFDDSAIVLSCVKNYKLRKSGNLLKSGFPAKYLGSVETVLVSERVNYIVFAGSDEVSKGTFDDNNFRRILEINGRLRLESVAEEQKPQKKEYDGSAPDKPFEVIPRCQKLCGDIFDFCKKAEKEYRFTLVKTVSDHACSMVHSACMANRFMLGSVERRQMHDNSLEELNWIQDLIPVLTRCRIISLKQEKELSKRVGSLRYGYVKWVESDERRIAELNNSHK